MDAHDRHACAALARAAWGRLWRVACVGALLLCAGAWLEQATAAEARPRVVATISILADFTAAVGEGVVDVETLVPVGGDPHVYEPVPSDARRLAGAALVIRNGAGLERWLDRLVGPPTAARPVATVAEALVGPDGDPHAWMDPVLAQAYVGAIEGALARRFPAHAARFAANGARYRAELARLDREIRALLQPLPAERRKLVTTHDAFRYFARRYDLHLVASLWGLSTETQPSAREIARVVAAVRTSGVPVVFVETTVNPKLMQRIARDAGVGLGAPLYGDSVGVRGSGADSYLGMMRANAAAIARGLGAPVSAP